MELGLDADVEIMFAVQASKVVNRHNLQVRLSRKYNRATLPGSREKNIAMVWEHRLGRNPKLWNGTKFRIDSVHLEDNVVVFNLGVTCYRDFLGTNWSPDAQDILQLGKTDFGNSHAYMSDALGVGALVATADHKVILLRRSELCAEAVGLYDIPGGHPEPKVCG